MRSFTRRSKRKSIARAACLLCVAGAVAAAAGNSLCAADPTVAPAGPAAPGAPPAAPAGTLRQPDFSAILKEHTALTYQAVMKYVAENPAAPDAQEAHEWLFSTALDQGFEPYTIALAAKYLGRNDVDDDVRLTALRVLGLGLAKTGKLSDAVRVLDEHLKRTSIQTPNDAVDFAFELVGQAQLAGQVGVATQILERLSSKFMLNAEVRRLVENRATRLALVGQPAPAIGLKDLGGMPVDLGQYGGKVLFVDFWATFCLPCIEEFPEIKQIYAARHNLGLEVLGISLDEDVKSVTAFQEKSKLPWRIALGLTDKEETRERYHAVTIPATFLIDRKGQVAYADLRGADLRIAVEKLLGTPP